MKRGKTNPIQRTTPGGGSYGGDFQPKYSTQIFNCYKKQPKIFFEKKKHEGIG